MGSTKLVVRSLTPRLPFTHRIVTGKVATEEEVEKASKCVRDCQVREGAEEYDQEVEEAIDSARSADHYIKRGGIDYKTPTVDSREEEKEKEKKKGTEVDVSENNFNHSQTQVIELMTGIVGRVAANLELYQGR